MAKTSTTESPSTTRGWILQAWRAHLEGARHENHVANSWARHHAELGPAIRACKAAAIARMVAFGRLDEAGARALLAEREAARRAKLALAA